MKKALKLIIPIVLALLLCGGAAWYLLLFRPSLTADYYVSRAEKAVSAGRYDRAVSNYESAEALDGSNVAIPLALAEAYRLAGNYTKAEYTLVRAISAFPDELSLYTTLSRVYVEQDKLLDAEQMLSRVANDDIRAQLSALRPAPPELSPESGYYNDYIEVSAAYSGGTVYLSVGDEYPTLKHPYTGPVQLERGETSVSAIVVSDDGLVSTLAAGGYTVGRVDEPVAFVDAALEDAVREVLGKSAGETIMSSELWAITDFTLPEGVTTLTDLTWFEAIEALTGSELHGIDLTVLASLPTLRSLTLTSSSLSSAAMEAIGSLTSLTSLDLSSCGLSSISALSGLTKLVSVNLSDNSIGNITPLENMAQLQELDLSGNAVKSLAVLVDLPELTVLKLTRDPISDLSPAAGCKKLTYLDVTGCGITDLSAVSAMTELSELHAGSNAITSLAPLSGCTALRVLDVSTNQITDCAVLASLTKLEIVKLDYNSLTSLPDLPAESALYDLSVTYNSLTDVEGLAALTTLNYLNIDYNSVTSLDCLADSINLIAVNAFANPIADVQALLDHGIIVNYDPTYAASQESDE